MKTTCICLNFINSFTTFFFFFYTVFLLDLLLPPDQLRPTRPHTRAIATAVSLLPQPAPHSPVSLSSTAAPVLSSTPMQNYHVTKGSDSNLPHPLLPSNLLK